MSSVESFWDHHGDPRVQSWFLMKSPVPVVVMSLGYVIFSKYIGPRIMKNRKAFDLKKAMVVYNMLHVAYNAWLLVEIWARRNFSNVSLLCEPMDHSTSKDQVRLLSLGYWYFILKLLEFGDGTFFVLRKKFNQISNLHVVHHSVMPASGTISDSQLMRLNLIKFHHSTVWLGLKLVPQVQSGVFLLLNVFVHVFMYGYYLIAALGLKDAIRWKKYITTLQLTQFVVIAVHSFQIFFTECDYPKVFSAFIGVHAILFFIAFKHFYNNAYGLNKAK